MQKFNAYAIKKENRIKTFSLDVLGCVRLLDDSITTNHDVLTARVDEKIINYHIFGIKKKEKFE